MENMLQKNTATPRPKFAVGSRRLDLFTAALFTLAYLLMVIEPVETPTERLLIVILGLASLFMAIVGYAYVQRLGTILAAVIYLLVQFSLTTVLTWLAGIGIGNTLMFLIALAQGSRILPLGWALVFCLYLPTVHIGMELQDLAREGLGSFIAGIFVVLITRVAVNEQRLRAEKEALAEELSEANAQLRSYALQAEELAEAKERNRLAREIHDGLGHHLTAATMQLRAARAVLHQQPEKAELALEKAETLTQDALSDVRRSVAALRTLERPLTEALASLVKETNAAGTLTDLKIEGTPRQLEPQVESSLYRVAQEGLTNVRKHAQATQCIVTLTYHPQRIDLVIEDNGIGSSNPSGGFGLVGVRERVTQLSGEMRVETAPHQGLKLCVSVPG
jgi:signal transduction histidine kinase